MKIKAIITGSTGMVGKGVLLECLDHSEVEEVLILNRRSLGLDHPKLKELVIKDFMDIGKHKDELKGYNACFHCMGVSVIGLSEEQYTHITYNMTKELADILYDLNKEAVFIYVSGIGTSESGRAMWAKVKGRTERYVMEKGFKDAYMYRPGMIIPERGIKSSTGWYNAIYVIMRPFFPLLKKMKNVTTTTRLGLAMINNVLKGAEEKYPENPDINNSAE